LSFAMPHLLLDVAAVKELSLSECTQCFHRGGKRAATHTFDTLRNDACLVGWEGFRTFAVSHGRATHRQDLVAHRARGA
jgi:hypothetical protein